MQPAGFTVAARGFRYTPTSFMQLWSLFGDLENMRLWHPDVTDVQAEPPVQVGEGAERATWRRWAVRLRGRRAAMRFWTSEDPGGDDPRTGRRSPWLVSMRAAHAERAARRSAHRWLAVLSAHPSGAPATQEEVCLTVGGDAVVRVTYACHDLVPRLWLRLTPCGGCVAEAMAGRGVHQARGPWLRPRASGGSARSNERARRAGSRRHAGTGEAAGGKWNLGVISPRLSIYGPPEFEGIWHLGGRPAQPHGAPAAQENSRCVPTTAAG